MSYPKFDAIMEKFAAITADPHATIKAWKEKTGKKVVLCAGLDVPEPMIEAAGMLPAILPEEPASVTAANPHVQTHICGYVRCMVGQAVEGKLDYADAIMISDACHELRMFGDLIPFVAKGVKKVQFIYLSPKQHDELGQRYTKQEFQRIRGYVEEIAGTPVTDEALNTAIRVYNENRKALLDLYDVRRSYPGIMSAYQVTQVVYASMLMPKAEHTLLVRELLEALEPKKLEPVSTKIPVVVSGSLCEPLEAYFLDTIEQTGGVVVDDDLYVGSRYFNTLYNEEMDPMEALQDAYSNRTAPCPTRYETRNLGEYLLEVCEKSKAQAVINIIVQHCEPHYYGYFTEHRHLAKAGMPELLFESELENKQPQQVKTRLQSFFESMEV